MEQTGPPGAVGKRRGTCRICFEEGGDLIQPCACKGSSQWIHRGCLDRWRTTGMSADAMTTCPSCKSKYRIRFQRTYYSDNMQQRKRTLLWQLATQSCGAFWGVQAVIICLGLLIREIDTDEELVQLFGLPQDPGQDEPGDFKNALHHHKCTYYLSGLIAFVALVGVTTLLVAVFRCCCNPGSRGPCDDLCRDCHCNEPCIIACPDDLCRCECPRECPQLGGGGGGGDAAAGILLILLVLLVVIGLVMIIVTVVLFVQRALQQFARLQELRILSEEYVVEDLASPLDLGEESSDARTQMRAEIDEILGGAPAPPRTVAQGTRYGV